MLGRAACRDGAQDIDQDDARDTATVLSDTGKSTQQSECHIAKDDSCKDNGHKEHLELVQKESGVNENQDSGTMESCNDDKENGENCLASPISPAQHNPISSTPTRAFPGNHCPALPLSPIKAKNPARSSLRKRSCPASCSYLAKRRSPVSHSSPHGKRSYPASPLSPV